MDKVAVVILNWNGKEIIDTFLPSVIEHSQNATIYVADNASTDDSVSFIQQNYPSVKLILNDINHGYANGYNTALKQIKAEYYILLNSDVEVTRNWIDPIIQIMDEDRSIAASQPKILSYKAKDQFEYAGAAGGFIDKDGFMFCRGRMFDHYENDHGQYDGVAEIFWATGACLFIRAELFHDIGGLDEDFFAHMEEIDVCWRLKNQGNKIYFNSNSVVYHLGGGTLSNTNPQKTYLNFRNNLYLLTKNYNQGNFVLKLFYRLILDGIAGLKFMFDLHPRHSFAVLHAHFSFYRRFPKFYRKRISIQKNVKQKHVSGLYKKSVVFEYFLFGKKNFSDLKPEDFTI
ncbi:MAG: glycosyltransferase family 2 protein [Bacteroidetes bacterium]|nr:MAG: glycosyltransferase family 2 protein [Bacteroidota bacterium]